MNYFDIIFAIIIIWAAIRGFTTGFIIQLSGLLALILGAFIAYKTSFWLAAQFSSIVVADPIIMNTIAFIITFAIVWILIVLLGKFLNVVIKIAMMGLINKILGVLFSVLKVVFALSIILMLVGNLNKSLNFLPKTQTDNSLLYNPIQRFAPAMFPYLKNGFEKAQKQWNENNRREETAYNKG